jgi:hypothetical protein
VQVAFDAAQVRGFPEGPDAITAPYMVVASCTISSMSSSAAFSSAMFTMCTKNGKLSPGTEKTT